MSQDFDFILVDHVPQAFADLVAKLQPQSLALSGGNTARHCYEHLAVRDDINYSSWSIFFSDERWVPVGDPDSNEGMARAALLDSVLPAAIHSLRHAGKTLEEAAKHYDALIREAPPIDFLHLGMGSDGHTASLFPNSPALEVTDHFVVTAGDDAHPHPRLTFTYPAISRCRTVVVTVEGTNKRRAFAELRAKKDLPAARISADLVLWLVDAEAAEDVSDR